MNREDEMRSDKEKECDISEPLRDGVTYRSHHLVVPRGLKKAKQDRDIKIPYKVEPKDG